MEHVSNPMGSKILYMCMSLENILLLLLLNEIEPSENLSAEHISAEPSSERRMRKGKMRRMYFQMK